MLKNDYPGKDFEGYPCCYPPAAEKLVLAQQAVDEKSNEITAVPLLLNMLDLKGTVVTSDAMNTQKNIAQQIIKAGGDYVLAVKGNHPTLEHSLKTTLDEMILENFKDVPHVYHQSTDGGHGRIVTRKVWAMTLPWHSPAPTSPPREI